MWWWPLVRGACTRYSMGMKEVEAALEKKGSKAQQIKVIARESCASCLATSLLGMYLPFNFDLALLKCAIFLIIILPACSLVQLGGFDEGELPNGEGPGFTWSQTKADVEVCVTLPTGTKAKQLAVDIKRNSLKVALVEGGVLFEAPQLNAAVNADESTWTIEDGSLMLTLEKARKDGIWRMLNVGSEGGDKGEGSSE